ncbi:MAG: hypothetical protein IKF56_01395 [Eggerthellaceae bacterium]|nr:hypothetical protein [Eggerthellaceae bacterium]
MAETTNYQCPNCNGRLHYNGSIGKLQCEFCGSAFTNEEVEVLYAQKQAAADAKAAGDREAKVAEEKGVKAGKVSTAAASTAEATRVEAKHAKTGDPIQDYLNAAKWDDSDIDNMRAYNCPSCGAQLMVDQVTAVTSCPYCGNNTVVPGQLSDVLKPDLVIPFKYDKNAAVAALKSYYQGKPLLPNSFTAENHIQEIQGVYVPFWLYSGTGTGDAVLNGRNVRTWSDKNNVYTETDHYRLYRTGIMEFDRVPVDGSSKMPDAHMDAIEPYDYSELVPFSMAYMPGYLAERYDYDVKQCDPRARNRAENTCAEEILKTGHGYMEVDVGSVDADVQWTNVAYALLPVWMLHTKWKGTDYLFAMNGQTGKLIGDLPIDQGKVTRRFIMMFLPLAIIIAVAIFFLFGF